MVDGPQGPRLRLDGRDVICACSNDYLGFANDPRLLAAGVDALETHGAGASASRLISGTMRVHREAEVALARHVALPAARLFSSGYAANVGTLAALATRDDLIFSDSLNHASLIDGCRLSRACVIRYPHGDVAALASLLRDHPAPAGHRFIVTDALFSMDGDLAPLTALRALADEHGASLYVDEAHSLGVFGPHGAGACAAAGVRPDVLLGTLGKAFGVAGAFVATDADTAAWLYNRARSFVFSTAPPPVLAAMAARSASLVADAEDRRAILRRHAARLVDGLRGLGFDVPATPASPIIPVLIGDEGPALTLAQGLLERGVFITAIRPPTVAPGTCRLRVVPTAAHTDEDVARILEAFASLRS